MPRAAAGADPVAATLLEAIRETGSAMKVVLGVWIAPDDPAGNAAQVAEGIRLANAYRDVVVGVSVGNETQVSWSAHRSDLDALIGYVKQVRAGVHVPITVADDFNFWNKPESARLSPELRELDPKVVYPVRVSERLAAMTLG